MGDVIRNETGSAGAAKVAGVLAEFDSPEALTAAAARVRDAGYRRWDCFSPLPIHGLDRAMGIRPTVLPWLVLGAGLTGGLVALALQWWTNAVEYPQIISGKPLFSLPANIPVTFELIVLFSSLTAFAGALGLSLLPEFLHPVFRSEAFRRVTSDAFLVGIEASDAKFDEVEVRGLFTSLGATRIETLHDLARAPSIPRAFYWVGAVVILLAIFPPVAVAWKRAAKIGVPRVQILQDMDAQPKFRAQSASALFLDGRSSRPWVANTIARNRLATDSHRFEGLVDGQPARTFPASIPLTLETMRRGQERYAVFCAVCHGLAGDGDGMVAKRAQTRIEPAWAPPAQLYAAPVRSQPVGQLYRSITNGVRTMPAYRFQIDVADRWAIVLYLQALQRSQAAREEDVPEDMRQRLK